MNLYNKYRPSNFDDLKGQDNIVEVIKSHLTDGTLPHALIFYGPPGTGKTSLSRIIAKELNPSNHGLLERDSAIDGGKDDIRLLVSDLYNIPLVGDRKTYIIDEAHLLTKQAFSSLLKVVEEPPPHVTFIFTTTDFEKIPANIKSRSKSFSFNKLNHTVIKDRIKEIVTLEGVDIPDTTLNLVTDVSEGSLRNAIVALETVITSYLSGKTDIDIANLLGVVGSSRLFNLVKAFIANDFRKLNEAIQVFFDDKTDSLKAIYDLQQYLMDSRMFLILGGNLDVFKSDISRFQELLSEKLSGEEDKDKIKTLKKQIGGKLDIMYDLTLDLEVNIKRTTNKAALFTRFIIKLAQVFK